MLDRPAVIARAVEHPRLDAQPGDAFVVVPAGFDTYLLVNVLHDWSDDDAVAILRRVAEVAVASGSRVIVIEGDRTVVPRDDLAICTDVLMAAMTNGGRERSPAAFADLGRAAALRLVQSIPLASGDLTPEFRPC